MNDRRDELVRRAVELRTESAALIVVSEELASRLAGCWSRYVIRPGR